MNDTTIRPEMVLLQNAYNYTSVIPISENELNKLELQVKDKSKLEIKGVTAIAILAFGNIDDIEEPQIHSYISEDDLGMKWVRIKEDGGFEVFPKQIPVNCGTQTSVSSIMAFRRYTDMLSDAALMEYKGFTPLTEPAKIIAIVRKAYN